MGRLGRRRKRSGVHLYLVAAAGLRVDCWAGLVEARRHFLFGADEVVEVAVVGAAGHVPRGGGPVLVGDGAQRARVVAPACPQKPSLKRLETTLPNSQR